MGEEYGVGESGKVNVSLISRLKRLNLKFNPLPEVVYVFNDFLSSCMYSTQGTIGQSKGSYLC
jgi:hypothetical protein